MSTVTETHTLSLRSANPPVESLVIKPGRLIDTIHETAKFGAKYKWGTLETDTGVCRLALTDEDKKVKDWFVEETKKLGCEVKIDEMGNIFAIFPGQFNDAKPTAMGSHLDTQPTGGRYDGILGVLSGLEVLRTLKENNYVPKYPIVLINWMNEEGARFPLCTMASAVWAGTLKRDDVYKIKSLNEEDSKTVEEELIRIGYKGDIPSHYELGIPIAAHFEIHIEQGPILEREGKKIGVVTGIQAYDWSRITVKGKAQHTGTTPFEARSDAMLAASKMIVAADAVGREHGGLSSVGCVDLLPGAVNVIPSEVTFTLDLRHVSDKSLNTMIEQVKEKFKQIVDENNNILAFEMENIHHQDATNFDETCIKCVEESSVEIFGKEQTRFIVSGASHDSGLTATRVPTSMIFIPSKDGVSHSPEEYSSPEQVHEGLQVLLRAVLKYDALRTE